MTAAKTDKPEVARTLARSMLADIALYDREDLRAGRDLTAVFDEARALFVSKTVPALHEVFEEELAAFIERDEARPDPPSVVRARRLEAVKMIATFVGVSGLVFGTWWTTQPTGDAVARSLIPGRVHVDAVRGDTLSFEVNHDVTFAAETLEDMPVGCALDLELRKGPHVIGTSHCDLFRNAEGEAISDASNAEATEDGLTHIEVFEARIACSFTVKQTGQLELRSRSNLDRCVPRRGRSMLQVFRSHGRH